MREYINLNGRLESELNEVMETETIEKNGIKVSAIRAYIKEKIKINFIVCFLAVGIFGVSCDKDKKETGCMCTLTVSFNGDSKSDNMYFTADEMKETEFDNCNQLASTWEKDWKQEAIAQGYPANVQCKVSCKAQ